MGFEVRQDSVKELPLWERYAHQFPVRDHLIYLNHAAVAPLCRPAADAMSVWPTIACTSAASTTTSGSPPTRVFASRRPAYQLDPTEIALMKNTSEGIATIAMGLDWKPGDRIVAFREEFPANYFPWKRLREKGVAVTWLSVERLAGADRRGLPGRPAALDQLRAIPQRLSRSHSRNR